MLSLLEEPFISNNNQHAVKNNKKIPQHDAVSFGMSSSVTKSLDCLLFENNNETHAHARTHTCTYKYNTNILPAASSSSSTIDNTITSTSHDSSDSSNSNFSLERAIEEKHTKTAIVIFQQQQPHNPPCPHNKPHYFNNSIIIGIDIDIDTQDKENFDTSNYNSNSKNSSGNIITMVPYNNNNDPWKEQDSRPDHGEDGQQLSPQMVKTITDLAMNKNKNDTTRSSLWGMIDFPTTDNMTHAASELERRDEKPSSFDDDDVDDDDNNDDDDDDDALAALMEDSVNKLVSDNDTDIDIDIEINIDTHDSENKAHVAASDDCRQRDVDEIEDDNEVLVGDDSDNDDDSFATSAETVFETFDDMSLLTYGDSIDDDEEDDDDDDDDDEFAFEIFGEGSIDDEVEVDDNGFIIETFEGMSLLTEDTKHLLQRGLVLDHQEDESAGEDIVVLVFSLLQVDLMEGHHHEQHQQQQRQQKEQGVAKDDYEGEDEVKLSEALRDSVLLDFLAGFCSKDE